MKALRALLAGVAAASLFAMMLITFADVIGRKFLGNSLTGAVELTELCMMVMIFLALPLASLAGEHVVFDLLDRLLPRRVLQWQCVLAHLITSAIFAGASWIVWVRSGRTYEMGDVTARLEIKLGPFHQMIAAMLLLTALVHLVLAWRDARHPPEPHLPAEVGHGGNT